MERDEIPKALNDFTRNKEEKARNEQLDKDEDGEWGKAQDDEEGDEDETSDQISKEEPPQEEQRAIEPVQSTAMSAEAFPGISNGFQEAQSVNVDGSSQVNSYKC